MSENLIMVLINAVIILLGGFGLWYKVKSNIDLVKEWIDVVFSGITALQDGKITKEEMEAFKKEWEEAKNFKPVKQIN